MRENPKMQFLFITSKHSLLDLNQNFYTVQCNAEALGLKVGYQIRVVGRLQQDIINDEVVIVAEHIEILNKGIVKNIIPNE